MNGDGIHPSITTSRRIARSSDGSNWEEMTGADGTLYGYLIFDVPGMRSIQIRIDGKTVYIRPHKLSAPLRPMASDVLAGQDEEYAAGKTSTFMQDGVPVKREMLGSRMIEGIKVFGYRNTSTVDPSHQDLSKKTAQNSRWTFSDKPHTATLEVWYSPELGQALSQEWHGRDHGVPDGSMKLSDVRRVEPDPALFRIPAGYTVVESNAQSSVAGSSAAQTSLGPTTAPKNTPAPQAPATAGVLAGRAALKSSGASAWTPADVPSCTLGVIFGGNYLAAGPIAGVPFLAIKRDTFDHVLADGNRIHGVARMLVARDSAGVTMTQSFSNCYRGEGGRALPALNVEVREQAGKIRTNWQVTPVPVPKIYRVYRLEQQTRSQPTEQQEEMRKFYDMARTPSSECKRTRLGAKSVNGWIAEGTRCVRTIPAGEEGNLKPLEVVTESWWSAELGSVVMSISDDPRRGRTTTELEEVRRGEPDPSLFRPPTGYVLQENLPGGGD